MKAAETEGSGRCSPRSAASLFCRTGCSWLSMPFPLRRPVPCVRHQVARRRVCAQAHLRQMNRMVLLCLGHRVTWQRTDTRPTPLHECSASLSVKQAAKECGALLWSWMSLCVSHRISVFLDASSRLRPDLGLRRGRRDINSTVYRRPYRTRHLGVDGLGQSRECS